MSDSTVLRTRVLTEVLQPKRKTRILDIGANPINGCPYSALLNADLCDVWGFEPQNEAFEKLVKHARANEHYLPYAIGDGHQHTLHICRSEGFTSLLMPNKPTMDFLNRWHKAMTVADTFVMQTKRLDDLDDLPPPDFVKIDVQGAEKMIFENGPQKLSQAVSIMTEVAFVPLYKDQPLFHEQARLLEHYGFLLTKFIFTKEKSIGSDLMRFLNWRKHQNQLIDGDALFIRSLIEPDKYTNEQLKHLAICADSIFHSFDLSLKCLSFLIERGAVDQKAVKRYIDLVPDLKTD